MVVAGPLLMHGNGFVQSEAATLLRASAEDLEAGVSAARPDQLLALLARTRDCTVMARVAGILAEVRGREEAATRALVDLRWGPDPSPLPCVRRIYEEEVRPEAVQPLAALVSRVPALALAARRQVKRWR